MQRTKRWGLLLAALMMVIAAAPATAATGSSSAVVAFADQETPVGTSQLIRGEDGVTARFQVAGLLPREALTLWWVVFNDPTGCSNPCNEDDIFVNGDPTQGINFDGVEAADIVVGYAAGTVASRSGKASMAAAVEVNAEVSEVLFGATPLLKSASGAEIHLVARSHGPAIQGVVAEQTGSYAGGCEVYLNPPEAPDAPGECGDTLFAVHLP